jgi:hypothetical protein
MNRLTGRAISQALVSRLESAGTFKDAKEAMSLVERTTYWDSSLSERLRSAVKNNDQVAGAFGVPERVESFINGCTG